MSVGERCYQLHFPRPRCTVHKPIQLLGDIHGFGRVHELVRENGLLAAHCREDRRSGQITGTQVHEKITNMLHRQA
jgi:hypothetical protein